MINEEMDNKVNVMLSLPNRIKILYDLEKLKTRVLCKSDILRELGYELVGNNYKILDILEDLGILIKTDTFKGISFFKINHRKRLKIIMNWEFYKRNISIYNWKLT